MKKKVLFLSIVCLLFITLSYTYSSFKSSIVGNINGNIKDWVFKVSVNNGIIEDGGYKLHLSGTSGSFNVNINTTNGTKDVDYIIELIGDSSIKFYKDSSYTNLISNNVYSGGINSNTNSSVTIYYKSDTSIDSDIIIKTKGNIMEYATMKNGYLYDEVNRVNISTEFWSDTYRGYIKTVEFSNNLSNMPSSCTEENLCWDISYDSSQKKKVYGYLIDTGKKDANDSTKALYNLYIVSESQIFAPSDCNKIFAFYKFENSSYSYISNLISINFNNSFNTTNVTSMYGMFLNCRSLTNLDLNSFNTSKVTDMMQMFDSCSSLTSLDLSSFDTSNVTNMGWMFYDCCAIITLNLSSFNTSKVTNMCYMFIYCSSLTNLDLSSFNTSNVTNMNCMFNYCSSLTSLDLSNFNTSKVTDMSLMFWECSSLTSLDLSNFNTSNVTDMGSMFYDCSSLTTTINIMNANAGYEDMFLNAATASGAKITVNYITSTNSLANKMIAEKSSSSKVVKGSKLTEYSIAITGNTDITYESSNKVKGTIITLNSISKNNYVTSFKMNGTTIEGNTFTMPDSDVTITDIVTVGCKIIETDHNPYLDSQNNVVLGEHTFEGAKSLTVILDYQTEDTSYDYFYIYDSSTSANGINNNKKYGGIARTTETITINSNYIKITFTSSGSGFSQNYYGLKAIVIPNY